MAALEVTTEAPALFKIGIAVLLFLLGLVRWIHGLLLCEHCSNSVSQPQTNQRWKTDSPQSVRVLVERVLPFLARFNFGPQFVGSRVEAITLFECLQFQFYRYRSHSWFLISFCSQSLSPLRTSNVLFGASVFSSISRFTKYAAAPPRRADTKPTMINAKSR